MRRDPKRQAPVLVLAFVLLAIVASPASAAPTPVTITGTSSLDYAFSPKTVNITKGGSVRWTWSGIIPHNVTFKTLGRPSESTTTGDYRRRFAKAGKYRYTCTLHGFGGKVVVSKP